ncbi:hypothetical protein BJ944DRAFT_263571 [Cunninghamella echinulata]|nr:hypothetical protein BJ944DRAFT_263571 [Cunninghamella echinulata]
MDLNIRITGSVISSILYECANSPNNIEGFLFGSISSTLDGEISDESDTIKHNINTFIIIHGYHCISPEYPLFYDDHGFITNEFALQQQLKGANETKNRLNNLAFIVGYFKFNRQRPLSPTVYEQNLLNCLTKAISTIQSPIMAFFSETSESFTRTYSYSFWTTQSLPKNLPIHVVNLNDNDLSFRQFISSAPITIPHIPDSSNEIEKDNLENQEIPLIKQYNEFYQHHMEELQKATENVIINELSLQALKQEIDQLKNRR